MLAYAGQLAPHIPTKSGLMLGLGETTGEALETMRDLGVPARGIDLGEEPLPQRRGGELLQIALPAGLRDAGPQLGGPEQHLQRVGESLRAVAAREHSGDAALDDLGWTSGVDSDHGDPAGHPLEDDDPEGLGIRGVHQHVHALDVGPGVRHFAGHRDLVCDAELLGEHAERCRVLG